MSAAMMRTFFRPTIPLSLPSIPPAVSSSLLLVPEEDQIEASVDQDEIFTGYLSDGEDSNDEDENNTQFDVEEQHEPAATAFETEAQAESTSSLETDVGEAIFQVHPLPPPKRCRHLDIPVLEIWEKARQHRKMEFLKGYNKLKKYVRSRKTEFQAGPNSLQEQRARAIQGTLYMMLKHGETLIKASEDAAAAQEFA